MKEENQLYSAPAWAWTAIFDYLLNLKATAPNQSARAHVDYVLRQLKKIDDTTSQQND